MGGVSKMILTHKDDVADHSHWSKALNCERWIHKNDAAAAPQAEKLISKMDSPSLVGNLKLIPTPGHTQGSIVVLIGEKSQILFSGDHLWWDPKKKRLIASRKYCWWNWSEQVKSIRKLLELDINWLFPGHGGMHQFEPGEWKVPLKETLAFLETSSTT